jgi:peptide/nickel transport system ATP-binding protein
MQDGRGSLHPNFTIRRLLQEVLELKGSKEATDELDKILHEVGLSEQVLDRKPGSLSGGECLRVSIARALLMDPQVLVCDESTSALDAATRDSLIDLLDNLMVLKSLAVVFISHDEYLVKKMSGQLIVMSDGKVVEQGPTADLVAYPTHEVTKKIFSPHATLRGGSSSLS